MATNNAEGNRLAGRDGSDTNGMAAPVIGQTPPNLNQSGGPQHGQNAVGGKRHGREQRPPQRRAGEVTPGGVPYSESKLTPGHESAGRRREVDAGAVACTSKQASVKAGRQAGNVNSKKATEQVQAKHHNKNVRGGSPFDKLKSGLNEYYATAWYTKAVGAGFKSKAALDRFNAAVAAKANDIDPNCAPVCTSCGSSDLQLCDDFIVANGVVAIQDDALVVPAGAANVRFSWDWFKGIRRAFTRPWYNSEHPINHQIGWMDNNSLPEGELLWADLASYIRLNLNTSYTLNGVFDRAAKLAHAKKLALRFFDENKVGNNERLEPGFVARVHFTVQRVTDQADDAFLLAQTNQEHNITSLLMKMPWFKRSFLTACLVAISLPFLPRIVCALLPTRMSRLRHILTTLGRTLANGRNSALKLPAQAILTLLRAISAKLWNGVVTPCYTAIQRLLCSIALIMSLTASNAAILRQPRQLVNLMGLSLAVL